MKVKRVARIHSGQDGAIWGPFLFRFQSDGGCYVYELARLAESRGGEKESFAQFRLDRAEKLQPHSNAVVFGSEYAVPGDEFPLLYTNIYNTYAKAPDRMEGTCCVYRLRREGAAFDTELLQVIQVDFTNDSQLWCSPDGRDVRPYGNFVIDPESNTYYAFTMRDADQTTRYFSFRLPKLCDGCIDENLGVRKVMLTAEGVIDYFDCPYHHYLQGACVHDGLIYSLEGFTDDPVSPPALRIIAPQKRAQQAVYELRAVGLSIEPELIDFWQGQCYYADHDGNLYQIQF